MKETRTSGDTSKGSKPSSSRRRSASGTCPCWNPVNVDSNAFHVTEEFTFSNGVKPDIRAEEIARAFEQRQLTTQAALEALERLIAEVKAASEMAGKTGLKPEAFAVYYILQGEGAKDPLKAAREVEKAFDEFPHWQVSERQEQDVRRSLYKALIDSGIEGIVEVVNKVMNVLGKVVR